MDYATMHGCNHFTHKAYTSHTLLIECQCSFTQHKGKTVIGFMIYALLSVKLYIERNIYDCGGIKKQGLPSYAPDFC